MILFPKHILSDFCSNRFRDSQTLESPFLYKLCSSPRYKAPKLLSSSFDDFIKSKWLHQHSRTQTVELTSKKELNTRTLKHQIGVERGRRHVHLAKKVLRQKR
ncbi:hypothetical protein Bca101_051756 [Brassica carinata]